MAQKTTIFQRLDRAITGNWNPNYIEGLHTNSYDMTSKNGSKILYTTTDKQDYETKKLTMQQDKFLKDRWYKANESLTLTAFNGLNNVKLMYRDADLMDSSPEIGAALDTYAQEATLVNDKAQCVLVYSQSDRIKSILEDLFVNRLSMTLMAPVIVRNMCKYGNCFMMLDIDSEHGVKAWRELPVWNVERIENGIVNPYGGGTSIAIAQNSTQPEDTSTKFVWLDDNQSQIPFRNWQIGHFRLINNSMYAPYGISILNAARRSWRELSLMEDMMLMYRLERSSERRVYKVYVGAIDDADVQAYVEQVATNMKRAPIIDPQTGQIDLRKNVLPVHKDTPIPLLDGRTITIENLAKEFEEGQINYVYSIQDTTQQIVPGKVVWCGKNYTADELVKITLDDDTYCVLAKEHEMIMRDGSKKRADQLVIGEAIMPFYRKFEDTYNSEIEKGEQIYNPSTLTYEFTNKLVANELTKENENCTTIYHKDYNSSNNSPDNLIWGEAMETEETYCESIAEFKNHKITNIEIVSGDDVYCMTVVGLNNEEDRHNFALCTFNADKSVCQNGCFVSNCNTDDLFVPVRDQGAASPVETLPAGNNLTAIDDIKYVQNKMLAALRMPRAFYNFEETAGEGKNLALMDVRFTRNVNNVQQAFLMELTKIATIHLHILGFDDELTNFSLAMNNPSTQAEQLEIETTQKKIDAIRDAVSDPGGGIPVMSLTKALKEIMHWSEKEIKDNFEEIRLEKGIAAELEKTSQIIKKTGIFNTVDRIYGEPGAKYQDEQGGMQDPNGGGGMPAGGGGGADFGSGLDGLGAPGADEAGAVNGEEGGMPMADMGGAPPDGGAPEPPVAENVMKNKPLITESKNKKVESLLFENYIKHLDSSKKKKNELTIERADVYDKSIQINEEFDKMMDSINKFIENEDNTM